MQTKPSDVELIVQVDMFKSKINSLVEILSEAKHGGYNPVAIYVKYHCSDIIDKLARPTVATKEFLGVLLAATGFVSAVAQCSGKNYMEAVPPFSEIMTLATGIESHIARNYIGAVEQVDDNATSTPVLPWEDPKITKFRNKLIFYHKFLYGKMTIDLKSDSTYYGIRSLLGEYAEKKHKSLVNMLVLV